MGFELMLDEIGTLINGLIHGEANIPVATLAIDSRTLASSESTLFIALKGDQHDGHNYIGELYDRGVRAFLVSQLPDLPLFPGAGFCLVKDTMNCGWAEMVLSILPWKQPFSRFVFTPIFFEFRK